MQSNQQNQTSTSDQQPILDPIIGIKVGSQNTILAYSKGKAITVIPSPSSSRTIPTIVSYNERDRAIGHLSLNNMKPNYKRTILNPNRYLGLKSDWSILSTENKFQNIAPISIDNNIFFDINYKNASDKYSPECLMGLFFQKLRKIWLQKGINTNKVVVSVPDYYTCYERNSMLQALKIAGLECVNLINESSAITLDYGISHFKDLDKEEPKVVGFIDMGYAKSSIFFSCFSQKGFKLLSVKNERFLGAREFDYLLLEHLSKFFESKYNCNPMTNQKCKIRLLNSIEKIRKNLTVNKEGIISVDSLMDGEDLVYDLTKAEFEKIVQPVLIKFEKLCKDALKKLLDEVDINLEDIDSMELAGEATRTPILQSIIKNIFNKDISKTLLSDQTICNGCVYYGQILNQSQYFPNIKVENYNPYSINLDCPIINKNGNDEIISQKLLIQGCGFPKVKRLKFNSRQIPKQSQITAELYYNDDEIDYIPDLLVERYTFQMPKKVNEMDNPDFKYTISLDENCLPDLYAKLNDKKLKIIQHDVPSIIPDEKLNEYITRESLQEKEDEDFLMVCNKKNEIEQFIYDMREKFNSGELDKYISHEDKNKLNKLMDPLLDWLYSGDEDCYNINALNDKSNEMFSLGKSALGRLNKWKQLDDSLYLFEKEINKAKETLQKEEFECEEDDLNQLNEIINKFELIYNKYSKECQKESKMKNPKINGEDIGKIVEEFKREVKEVADMELLNRKRKEECRNKFMNDKHNGWRGYGGFDDEEENDEDGGEGEEMDVDEEE